MQTIPLTPKDRKKLVSESIKGNIIVLLVLSFFGIIAHFITSALDKDAFFVAYIIWSFLGFIGLVLVYQTYNTWRDLQVGTKKLFETLILDKEHSITHSTSGTGNSRTTTTHHHYYFVLEHQPQLTVSEKQYDAFRQGQRIQVEKLSYSGTLWDIIALDHAQETLPASEHIQTEIVPLEENEKVYLQKMTKMTVVGQGWLFLLMTMLFSVPISMVSFFLPHKLSISIYQVFMIASVFAVMYVVRHVSQRQARNMAEIQEGITLKRLCLKDKEIIKSGGNTYRLIFHNLETVSVPLEVYEELQIGTYYWVGKPRTLGFALYLQDENRQRKWYLERIT